MAKPFFCTMMFEGSGRGWTESYVYNSGAETHEDAMKALTDLAKLRRTLLGAECSITHLRVSEQSDGPDAMLDDVVLKGNAGQESAAPDVALVMRLTTGNQKRWKHTFLRGIWDAVETEHGKYVGHRNKPWSENMKFFKDALVFLPWGWWGVVAKNKVKVTNYTTDAGGRVNFTLDGNLFADLDVTKNKSVRVSRVNGKSRVNRQHVVEVLTRSTCRTFEAFAAGEFRTSGFMTFNTLGFVKIEHAYDRFISERKVGAPLLHSPGHARRAPKT